MPCWRRVRNPGSSSAEKLRLLTAEGRRYQEIRLESMFYGDLPCLFWPEVASESVRPEPLLAAGVPTLVLTSTEVPPPHTFREWRSTTD